MDWGWLLKLCIGAFVCWYAQVLGLDSREAKCAAGLIPYKSDLVQNKYANKMIPYKSSQAQPASYPLHIT